MATILSTLKSVLGNVAPTIAAGLGGPLAGAAVAQISRAVLGKDSASDDELTNAVIAADPETLAKVKQADEDFRLKMEQLGVNVYQIEVQDRSNARDLFKVDHAPQIILSIVITFGFFTALFIVLSGLSKALMGSDQVGFLLLGALTTAFTQVLNFWFGSTQGSQAKTNLLAAATSYVGKAAG